MKIIVITDSLRNLMAQETLYTKANIKKTELNDLLAEGGSLNLTLMDAIPHGHHG
jgi:hypothetical protein